MATYTSQQACRLAGVSYRRLDYWVRQRIVKPSEPARGSGSSRGWSPLDVVQLRVMAELRQAGVSLQRIRRAVNWLRKALPQAADPVANLTFVTDGKRVFYLSPNPGKLVDVLAGGQVLLSVPMGDVLREIPPDLPPERPTHPINYDLPEVIEPGESGYYVGYCPVLRGCVAQGRTREEAHSNLKKAIASYLEVLEEMAQEEAQRRERLLETARA